MNTSDEKLCLKWNDFNVNAISAFGERRKDEEFSDVTLVCEDGQEIDAHKFVLASASSFFLNLLRRNKHPHPLIYMRGVKSEDLMSIVDFLYFGETNVFQERLVSFLAVAEELKIKGLTESQKPEELAATTPQKEPQPLPKTSNQPEQTVNVSEPNRNQDNSVEGAVALHDSTVSADLHNLNEQIKSMMETGEQITVGNQRRVSRICKVCGKTGQDANIRHHIEENHILGVSHMLNCNLCGKTSTSRKALRLHMSYYHK